MKPFRYTINLKAAGVTLIEAVIASVIMLGALGSAVTLMGTSSLQIADNQNRLTATYLVQECLELSRNARDSAAQQTLWHCPFFEVQESSGIAWDTYEKELSIAHGSIDPSPNVLNCQQDFGVTVADAQNSEASRITLNNTTFDRTLTVKGVEVAEKSNLNGVGTYEQVQQFTAQCAVEWVYRGKDRRVEASQILTRWIR